MTEINIDNINKYFDSIDIIYWINLDRAENRRNNMIDILKYFPAKNERISAIDGKKETLDEILSHLKINENNVSPYIYTYLSNFKLNNKNITQYEYACLLSHLNTIKKFSETNYRYALIFEDDISLEYSKYWNKKISEIINQAPDDWDILMLGYTYANSINNNYELVNNNYIYGAFSYVIKNKSAKEFIKNIYKDNKFEILNNREHNSDIYIFSELKTYCYKYPYFTYFVDNESTIHNDHLDFHKSSKNNTKLLWENYSSLENDRILTDNKTFKVFIGIIIIIILVIIILILQLNYQI